MSVHAKGSSTTRRAAVIAIGVIASVVSFAPTCFACTCPSPEPNGMPPEEQFDVLIKGRVYDVATRPDGTRAWHFRVQYVRGAETTEYIDVITGPVADDCAATFTVGGRYEVYGTYDAERQVTTDMCAPNKAVSRSTPPYAGDTPPEKLHGAPYRNELPPPEAETVGRGEGDQQDDAEGSSTSAGGEGDAADAQRHAGEEDEAPGEERTGEGSVVEAAGEGVAAAATPNLFRDYAVTIAVWAAVGLPVVWMMRRRRSRA